MHLPRSTALVGNWSSAINFYHRFFAVMQRTFSGRCPNNGRFSSSRRLKIFSHREDNRVGLFKHFHPWISAMRNASRQTGSYNKRARSSRSVLPALQISSEISRFSLQTHPADLTISYSCIYLTNLAICSMYLIQSSGIHRTECNNARIFLLVYFWVTINLNNLIFNRLETIKLIYISFNNENSVSYLKF